MSAVHALARSSALLPSIMHDEDPRLMVELHLPAGRQQTKSAKYQYSDADFAVSMRPLTAIAQERGCRTASSPRWPAPRQTLWQAASRPGATSRNSGFRSTQPALAIEQRRA